MESSGEEEPEALLERALAVGDRDSHDRWDIVAELHRRTDPHAFAAAYALARSADLEERVLGLDVLGQIGYTADRPFLEDSLAAVLDACADGRAGVIDSAVCALGHLGDERGRTAVLRHAAHDSADVRFSVALSLPGLAGESAHAEVVDALITLSRDPSGPVRDWATLALGSELSVDTPAVRDALAARLGDLEGETAEEALLGLARRHDERALAPLLRRLREGPTDLVIEAATVLGSSEALPELHRLKRAGRERDELQDGLLDQALLACSRTP